MRVLTVIWVLATLLVACHKPSPTVVPPAPVRTGPLPLDHELVVLFERTRQEERHPKEAELKSFLQGLSEIVYGQGRLEWINDRTFSLEHPQGLRQGPEDLTAWKRYAPRMAFAAKYDFSGDYARVLWVERAAPFDEAFFIFLTCWRDRWMLLGDALSRGNGDSWKVFYNQQSAGMEIGRAHFERQSKGCVTYPTGYTDDELMVLIQKVEGLSRKDGKFPVGLWFDLLYSHSDSIRNYGTDQLVRFCGVKAGHLKDLKDHDPWFQDIGQQLRERYPKELERGLGRQVEIPAPPLTKPSKDH